MAVLLAIPVSLLMLYLTELPHTIQGNVCCMAILLCNLCSNLCKFFDSAFPSFCTIQSNIFCRAILLITPVSLWELVCFPISVQSCFSCNNLPSNLRQQQRRRTCTLEIYSRRKKSISSSDESLQLQIFFLQPLEIFLQFL